MKQAKTTKSVDYSGDLAKVSIEILGDEFSAKLLNSYGTQATPPVGTPCLVVAVGNNDFNKYIIPLQIGLEQIDDDEYKIGNFDKSATIHFKADGTIFIEGASVEVNNSTVNVTGGDVTADGISLKTHKHSAGALLDSLSNPVTGSTGVPS